MQYVPVINNINFTRIQKINQESVQINIQQKKNGTISFFMIHVILKNDSSKTSSRTVIALSVVALFYHFSKTNY